MQKNELSIVSQFLSPVWVKGRVISADALHTQLTFCSEVTHGGGYFLLVAKGNQPTLRDDLQASHPLTARIGAPHAPSTKAMDDWKSVNWKPVPNSTSSWRGNGQAWCRSFGWCVR